MPHKKKKRWQGRRFSFGFSIIGIIILGGCVSTNQATLGGEKAAERQAVGMTYDPCEKINRCIFEFNNALDTCILKPIAGGYKEYIPEPIQDGVHNVLINLRRPAYVINDLLQGDGENAERHLCRFLVNSTVGIGGIFNYWDDEPEREDFGQTLAVAGFGPGPYIVLPFLGPSNLRDSIGLAVDIAFDPLTYVSPVLELEYIGVGRFGFGAIDTRKDNLELVEDLKANALDYYARVRSIYSQHRQDLIEDKATNRSMYGSSPASDQKEE